MISLQLKAEFDDRSAPPFVVKVQVGTAISVTPNEDTAAIAVAHGNSIFRCKSSFGSFTLFASEGDNIDGDVLLCMPARGSAHRIIRRNSRHNTLLFTERCDQLCVMCSQPPKDVDDTWRFPLYEKALHLADADALIGISGGEPTLFKDDLFGIIERVYESRPDISYHILSNGQHFSSTDHERLLRLHENIQITWGIPLYSHVKGTHEKIVGKSESYDRLLNNLFLLASAKANIELRTVLTAINVLDLAGIANFIGKHLPFITDWAIMAMEPIGYARANRNQLFFDHSAFPQPLVDAVSICQIRNLPIHFYNIPRCTVPSRIRSYCVDSISDWKKKYLPVCTSCTERDACCGFFEWYNDTWAWSGVRPIHGGETS